MFEYLPQPIRQTISKYNIDAINEIRLRVGMPMFIQVNGQYYIVNYVNNYVFTYNDIDDIILKLTKHSIYAYKNNLLNGYLCGCNGERIGVCGQYVYDNNILKGVKGFSSLCIRIPHEVKGCADKIINQCFYDQVKNILVISPPGGGKTTILRDLTRIISYKFMKNILLIDEKNELFGEGKFDIGNTTDVILYGKKDYGFSVGVANLRPDVIITDEIINRNEMLGCKNAILSGVKVIASIHGNDYNDVKDKDEFKLILTDNIFDYAVILSSKKIGQIVDIVKL